MVTTYEIVSGKWFVDSCTSQQMTSRKDVLHGFRATDGKQSISTAAQNVSMTFEGYGSIRLQQNITGRWSAVELQNIAYMSDIRRSLVSLLNAQAAGISIEYPPHSSDVITKKEADVVTVGCRQSDNI